MRVGVSEEVEEGMALVLYAFLKILTVWNENFYAPRDPRSYRYRYYSISINAVADLSGSAGPEKIFMYLVNSCLHFYRRNTKNDSL